MFKLQLLQDVYKLYKQRKFDKKWTAYKNSICNGVDEKRLVVYNTILDNTMRNIRDNELWEQPKAFNKLLTIFTDTTGSFLAKNGNMFIITKLVLDKLIHWNLVGVQPLSSPVGLVYSLQYRTLNQGVDEQDKKIAIEIVSQAIAAISQKLSASWSVEAEKDLKDLHDIDIEQELTAAIASEIAFELNNILMNELYEAASNEEVDIAQDVLASTEKITSLILHINVAANEIARTTRRGTGNFAVIDPSMLAYLQAYKSKVSNHVLFLFDDIKLDEGLVHVGYISGTIKLYVTPVLATEPQPNKDVVLVGYKGASGETDVGYIYSPYILAISSGIVINPNTFAPCALLTTRFGKVITGEEQSVGRNYYRKVTFSNLI